QGCRDGHDFECRSRLIDVTDGAILQSFVCDSSSKVRIESWAICKRQDFASTGVRYDYRACPRASLLHCGVKFALGNVLSVLVDGKDDVLTGIRLLLQPVKILSPGIDLNQHASRLAAQLVIVLALDAAQPFIVHTDVPKDVSCKFPLRIKPLGFFLEIDPLQV